ncbi:helix-turn-helix domain-containing protein [Lacipirellula sp.]|uniref:helix-turn-helix domain-containing protein n=1 Tax=Lacipirellula sp. TaxID=2691419 RepID=UPI003D0C9BD4
MSTNHANKKLTPAECAHKLGVGGDKVYGWIRSGELRAINVASDPRGRPLYKISIEDLAAFEHGRQVAINPAPTPRPRRQPKTKDYFPDVSS